MDVPQVTANIILRDPNAPVVPILRRRRRTEVEDRLLLSERSTAIAAVLSEKYGVSPRIVFRDIKIIRRRWELDESKRGWTRRQRVVRSLERLAAEAYTRGDPVGARDAEHKIGRLLGMGVVAKTVNIDRRTQVVVFSPKTNAEVDSILAEVARRALALGMISPASVVAPVAEPAHVVNGNGSNGHA